jgi:tRNA1(Val) A37 N6-methylase TrmN6
MFGITKGFDIVIGNPPYISASKAYDDSRKFADLYKDCKFKSFERTGDIYCLFYERGIQF